MEEKPNEPAFPENETVCYDNVSAMDMTIARNMAMTIAIKLQCALGANGFGADRQLVVGRIFDMPQRQSLRRDRSCGAFAQRSRHFSCKPVEGTFADTDLHAAVDEGAHHIACKRVGDDHEADEARFHGRVRYRSPIVMPSSISVRCGTRRQYAVFTSRMVVPPGFGVANEPKSCRPIVIAAASFMALRSKFIVDMQYEVSGTRVHLA